MPAQAKDASTIETWPPLVRELYEYWDRKRNGRPMPSRADIDPIDMKRHLPFLLLVDVVPDADRFVYRLVGTGEVSIRGHDPTGRDVADHFYGPNAEETLACYRYVRDNRAFLLDSEPFISPDGRYNQGEVLFLPLSRDGERVDQILVYSNVTMVGWKRAGALPPPGLFPVEG